MKNIVFLFSLMVFICQLSLADNVSPGPVLTDDEIQNDLLLDSAGMEKVKAAVQTGDLVAVKAAYLDYRRHGSTAKWTVMPSDEPATAVATTDAEGDDTCAHRIHTVWNKQGTDMGADFDWTHSELPRTDPAFSLEWGYLVARCSFWKPLADAYWKTHNEKYAEEWVKELADFAAKNPVPPGLEQAYGFPATNPPAAPTMWRSLDAAIRVKDNWPYVYNHFLNSPSFTPDANWLYLKLMQEHGVRLMETLKSNPTATGNQILTEAVALYTIGVLFPELRDAEVWRDTAMDRVGAELDRAVPPDGFEAELTPNYDGVCMEDFSAAPELAKLNGLPVPPIFQTRLPSMYKALVLVMDQSGNDVPTNDSHSENAVRRAKDGLKLGPDPLLEWAASGGTSGTAPPDSTMLPYAGFYAMRGGWKPDDLFLFFRGGPIGIGHGQESDLEVFLRAWNKTLLFEQGNYQYDYSEWRKYVIGTASHNTVTVDGKWQHREKSKVPVPITTNPWVTTPLFDFVASTYDAGYQEAVYTPRTYYPINWKGDLDKSVTHTRRILYLRPYYALVLDTLDGSGHHTFDANFHLDAPAAHIDAATQAAFSDNKDDVQLGLYPLDRDHLTVDIVQGQMKPMLGWWASQGHRAIPTVRFEKKQDAPATFATFLYPYKGDAPSLDAQPLTVTGEGIWSQTLTTPKEQAEIVFVKSGMPESFSYTSTLVGAVQMNAAGFLARKSVDSGDIFTGGWGLTTYQDAKTQFTLATPGAIALVFQGKSLLIYNGGDQPVVLKMTLPYARTATLPPETWTEISADGVHPGTAPVSSPFASFN
jgi:hypothetical protein